MKDFNLQKYLKKNVLLKEGIGGYVDMKPATEEIGTAMEEAEENEYSFMDNYELVGILQKIHDVYDNPELINIDTEGVTTHIKQAISLIKARTGN